MKRRCLLTTFLMLAVALLFAVGPALAEAWKFGVMCDTQWIGTDDGKNPNTVSVDIIKQLNQQFIDQGVKFVIQTGDLVDSYNPNSMSTTAVFRHDLYNVGIGFLPLRGNHESNSTAANQFVSVFPQTQSGLMNATPVSAFSATNPDSATQPFPVQAGLPFTLGTISAIPPAPNGFTGLNYALDYDNARFVFLDQFTPTTGTSHSILDDSQVSWMDGQLAGRPANTHAFVFGHKGIITQNHTDGLFGLPSDQPARTNNFVGSLATNGVRYYMGGHDHMHNRAIVASPDHASSVQNIAMASDSSKFYIPYGSANFAYRTVDPNTKAVSTSTTQVTSLADPLQTNDYIYNVLVAGGSTRETPLSQELNTVGYYIYTVDGAKVTVDFYSAVVNPSPVLSSGVPVEYLISATPTMTFAKRETFGYSLNGHEYLVAQSKPYTVVNEKHGATTARILSGVNGSTATDSAGRKLTKAVNTGWTPKDNGTSKKCDDSVSDILTLWGMTDLGAAHTDTYVISMSYDPNKLLPIQLGQGLLGLATWNGDDWVNAVDKNDGGIKKFVLGPYKSGYKLGTYGIDLRTHTAWAVINYDGEFAVAGFRHLPFFNLSCN